MQIIIRSIVARILQILQPVQAIIAWKADDIIRSLYGTHFIWNVCAPTIIRANNNWYCKAHPNIEFRYIVQCIPLKTRYNNRFYCWSLNIRCWNNCIWVEILWYTSNTLNYTRFNAVLVNHLKNHWQTID